MRVLIAARNRTVAFDRSRIVPAEGPFDLVLEFPQADVRPGLINSHDHLHRNHYGRLGEPPYRHASAWARDIQLRYCGHIARQRTIPRRDALLVGAWKNLFAGVTSVVHHDPWEPDFDHDFPLRVVRLRTADSLAMDAGPLPPAGDGPFAIHLAEGIDADAAEELRTLAACGMLDRELIAVHGVGIDAAGVALFHAAGAALVWCPSSNHFLFGRTAPAELLGDEVDVLLGSDSLLTGAGDLLDELRYAAALDLLDVDRLEQAVGAVASARLGLPAPSLEPGGAADILVIGQPITKAMAKDVSLVVVGGVPRVARPDLAPHLTPFLGEGQTMRVGTVTRWTNMRPAAAPKREICDERIG